MIITKILAYLFLAVTLGCGLWMLWTAVMAPSTDLEPGARLIGFVLSFAMLYGAYAFARSAGL